MKVFRSFIALSALVLAAATAKAQSGISLGEPAYNGSGCPIGSASATITPDGKTLSLLFDSFIAEAGNTTGRRIDRKSCNLRVPVHVPQGYSVAVIGVDYRGFNAIPGNGAYTELRNEYFYAGSRGPVFQKRFNGPRAEDYTQTNKLIATSLIWSECGKDVNLAINSSIVAMSNSQMQQTMMTVDSVDISAGLIYSLQWRRCN
ncbi:MAG: DUF4360 domain-containing protein [Pseudobdellovibrio sp.]